MEEEEDMAPKLETLLEGLSTLLDAELKALCLPKNCPLVVEEAEAEEEEEE